MQTATDIEDWATGARLSPLAHLLVIAVSATIILAGLKAAAEIAGSCASSERLILRAVSSAILQLVILMTLFVFFLIAGQAS
ncbi:MAG: hypothetical protein WCE82_08060 [Halobacteriota archaeon]